VKGLVPGHWIAGVLLLLMAAPASAQDLSPRKGFSVRILEPETGSIVSGPTLIKAGVTVRDEKQIDRVLFYVNDKLILADREPPWQVEYDFGATSRQHVIRVVARHKDGPEVSDFAITRTLDLEYVVNVQRVILDVSVRDRARHVVTGLGKNDFRIEEEGKPQRLVEVSREERPLLIGILMDSSGSMRERMDEAKEAACGFLHTLREGDRTFVIDFDERVFLIEEIGSSFDDACTSIGGEVPVGGTAMYDAIHAAFRVTYQTEAERRAFVILTDGNDTESELTLDEIEKEAQLSDVTIYAIGLGVAPLSEARAALESLTKITGGRAFFIKKAKDLASTYDLIAEELRTLYQVVYASDNEIFDGRFIKVDVRVKGKQRYDIRHRLGYYAVQPSEALGKGGKTGEPKRK